MSACRRIGAQQKIHTKATEVRKGHEGLKEFRIYKELDADTLLPYRLWLSSQMASRPPRNS